MRASEEHPVGQVTWGWIPAGLILIAIQAVLLSISPRFAYGELPVLERSTGLMVAMMVLAGAVYLSAIWLLTVPARPPRWWWLWIISAGLAMRALMFPSTPMLETDYFRYLWDGGALAHGHSPYGHAPTSVLHGDAPLELVELGEESGLVLDRVNHPWLTTIYPPTAQTFFAIAHTLAPWKIEGLRAVWLVLDLITLALLAGLLRELRLPVSAAMIYWWNPLLIKEAYNSAHMELAILPFVIAAVWFAVRYRHLAGAFMLALAVGAKLWPALLLPALLRRTSLGLGRTTAALGVFLLAAGLILAPMFISRLDHSTGVRAYAETWEINDLLFRRIHTIIGWILPGEDPANSQRVTRILVVMILLAWIGWLCRRPTENGRIMCERALWIIAALFLLSPTGYPWYWLWMLPLLVVRPSPGLLLLTAALPLYYLRFPLRELDASPWFNHGIVAIEYVPTFLLLAWEALHRRASTSFAGTAAETTLGH